jgi:thiol-disulfide isomerase/thioredoxin
MKNIISVFLFTLNMIACTSPNANDSSPVDDLFSTETCGGAEADITCNIESFDQNNEPFNLYTYYGNPLVVDLSAMWCGPCKSAALHAQEVQDFYSDQGLVYITVLVENTAMQPPTIEDLVEWADTYGNTSALVIAGNRNMLKSSGTGTWAVEGWPTFYYIDENMVIRDIDRGFSEEEVYYSINAMLGNQ